MQAYPRTSDNRWTDIMTTVLKSHYYAPLLCCICSMFIYSVQMFLCGVCRIEERQCGSWLVFDVIYYLSTATSLFMEWCIDIVHWLAIHCLSFPTTKHCTPSRDIFIKYIRLLHALEIHVPYIVFIGGTRNMKYSRFLFFFVSIPFTFPPTPYSNEEKKIRFGFLLLNAAMVKNLSKFELCLWQNRSTNPPTSSKL